MKYGMPTLEILLRLCRIITTASRWKKTAFYQDIVKKVITEYKMDFCDKAIKMGDDQHLLSYKSVPSCLIRMVAMAILFCGQHERTSCACPHANCQ